MENIDVSLKGVNVSVPYSLEAEQAILGAALIDPETVSVIVEQVKPEYFYVGKNKRIFSEIRMLFLSNTATDVITVNNAVLRAKIFDDENESKVLPLSTCGHRAQPFKLRRVYSYNKR